MNPDTILTLGDFAFSGLEIPAEISFGGDQAVAVHELVGGTRIVDTMGRRDAKLEWSGLLLGETALERAHYLDALRVAGRPLLLAWSDLSYSVVIETLRCTFQRFYQLPYSISCVVVSDLVQPITYLAAPSPDDQLNDDMATANGIGASIGDGTLTGLLSTLNSALVSVSSFATATNSQINGVLMPLAAVQGRTSLLIGQSGNALANLTTLGGVAPNNPISTQSALLTNSVVNMNQLPQLYNLQSALGRMGTNLGSLRKTDRTTTTAGGNLYQIASQQYGDPSAWTTLAKANNTTDPMIASVENVYVPPLPDGMGGVLSD